MYFIKQYEEEIGMVSGTEEIFMVSCTEEIVMVSIKEIGMEEEVGMESIKEQILFFYLLNSVYS